MPRRSRYHQLTRALCLVAYVAGAALTAGVLETCTAREPAAPTQPNVIVLLVDTLRAQSLGTYDYERPTSPRLDALAREGFLFEQARAQAPCTFPSVNSILTGQAPSRFSSQKEGRMGIPEATPSIAEILRGAGYATSAVSASPIVRKNPSRFNPHGGFDRGFDRFDDSCVWKDASCLNEHGLRELATLQEPFFLYLHYMDPHGPYRPPEGWPRQFANSDYDGPQDILRGDPNPIAKQIAATGSFEPGEFSRADIDHLRDLYDDEIAYFDAKLGEMLDELASRGLTDRTILVLLADHGEEFLEHGQVKHCHMVYDTEVKTPLLIDLPPAIEPASPRRITTPAANLDLLPTLLDYLEIEPPIDLPGKSLRGAIGSAADRGVPRRDPVVSSWAGLRSATDGRFKLIVRLGTGDAELYNLANDPDETTNLLAGKYEAPRHREYQRQARRLGRAIDHWIQAVEAKPGDEGAPRWDDDALERLRSLGYIQ